MHLHRLTGTDIASTRTRRHRTRSRLRAIAALILGGLALMGGATGGAQAQEPAITVRFEKEFHQYGESSQSGRITLEARTAANVAPTENFTLTVFTEDANTEMPLVGQTLIALAGSDFTAFRRTYTFRPSEFALEAGQYVARKLVQLQITDDDVVEKLEDFGVAIERANLPAHVTLHSIKFSVALVIINSDDEAQISASAPRTVTEGKAYDYVLTVDKEVAFPFTVVISTVDMTATPAGGDYAHFTKVAEFEPHQRRLVQRVRTLADTLIESNEQLGVRVVGNGLDPTIHLPDDQTTVTTIIDATTPDWSVTHAPAQGATTTVKEDSGSWRMTVDSGGVTWPTDQTIHLDLTAAAATADGCAAGAVHGEDFHVSDDSDLSGHAADTLVLRAGRTRVTATFAIVDDAHYEPPETVIVTAHHEAQRIAAPHVVTIHDDQTAATLENAAVDGRTVTLTFTTPMTYVAPESDPYLEEGDVPHTPEMFFTLFESKSPGVPDPTDSNLGNANYYKTVYGTGARTFDLSARVVTLTFPHAVDATHDAWVRYNRFSRYSPLGATTESLRCTNGRPRHAVASFITELDGTANTGGTTPRPALTIDDAEGREGTNANIAFTVTLNPASSELVTVDYKTIARTATEGEDFTRTRGTLRFEPGQTTKTVRVPIIDDNVEDDGETFLLDLYEASGATMVDTESWATGTIRNTEEEEAPPPVANTLTATFSNVPAEHGGGGVDNRFTFDLNFSENVKTGYAKLRDRAFTITGGDVKTARRKVQGSNQSWTITVEPYGWGDVSLTLPGGRACTANNAICTYDERSLSNSPSATIQGPAALSVADASAQENTDPALEFAVSLDRPSTLTVTVDYATSNGTASAGQDYTATSGTLTFNPGDTAKTVSVPVLNDAIDDGGETMTLTLSNADNARIADATATGTIENSDPLQQAWIARFGRTVASDVVDGITDRLANRGSGSQVQIAGVTLNHNGSTWTEVPAEETELGDALEGERTLETNRTISADDLLLKSTFRLQGRSDAPGGTAWGAWGRFSQSSFDGQADGVTLSGDVTTGLLGADVGTDEWTAGVALSAAKGDGPFELVDNDDANTNTTCDRGTVKSTLTSVHPYAEVRVSDAVDLWAIGGYGAGDMTIEPTRCDQLKTDIDMMMAAVGLRGQVMEASAGDAFDAAVRTDVLWLRATSDRSEGLLGAEADVTRLRLMVDAGRAFTTAGGATLTPTIEAGVRRDAGDAEEGVGFEVGGGIAYQGAGITIEGKVRKLIAHDDSAYEEWGASAAVRIDPGSDGRGMSLAITPTWGNAVSEAEQLWSTRTAEDLVGNAEFEAESRLDAELGYGIGGPHGLGLLTPYAGLTLADGAQRTMRTGLRWKASQSTTIGLEASREESDGSAANALMLRFSARF